jgi:Mg/Co/Ni transporter MgtE
MILLRRALGAGAAIALVLAAGLLVAPGWLIGTVLGQTDVPPDVWLRLLGAALLSLGLVHVLILRKLDDLWWWTWAIVAFDALAAVILASHVAVGLPPGSAAWPWWVLAGVSAAFTAVHLAGLARAGQEKPFA